MIQLPRRRLAGLLRYVAAASTMASALACTSADRPSAADAHGGTLIAVVPAEPSTLLPPRISGTQGGAIAAALFDRLADIGPQLETIGDRSFRPRLATAWRWADDSLSIAFTLDTNARWHDGAPLRAADVRYTFAVYTNDTVATEHRALLANIDSVTTGDAHTAIFWFRTRQPQQFYDATYHMYILPSHLLDTIPMARLGDAPFGRQPVGTGRFRFARWDAGQRIEIVADSANPRGRAALDRVIWTIAPDVGAATVKLFSGEADFYELIRPENLPQMAKTPTLRLVDNPALQYGFLGFNLQDPQGASRPHPVLQDVRVRRALSMAIDRPRLAQNVFDALGLVGLGPAPRALIPDTTAFRQLPFDTTAAKALLDSAGWRDHDNDGVRDKDGRPLAFEVLVPNASQTRQRYAVLLQEQYRAIGVKATPLILEVNALIARIDRHAFDAYMGSWQTSPGLVGLRQTWASSGGGNAGRYASPAFDAALDSALTTFDASAARRHWARAFQQIVDDAPAVWLYEQRMPVALHTRFIVPALRADGWYADLAEWRIDPTKRLPRDQLAGGSAR